MNLNDKVAIVTGGASGFGAAIARRLGQSGATVLVADLKVDRWYYQRYCEWAGRLNDTYTSLSE